VRACACVSACGRGGVARGGGTATILSPTSPATDDAPLSLAVSLSAGGVAVAPAASAASNSSFRRSARFRSCEPRTKSQPQPGVGCDILREFERPVRPAGRPISLGAAPGGGGRPGALPCCAAAAAGASPAGPSFPRACPGAAPPRPQRQPRGFSSGAGLVGTGLGDHKRVQDIHK